MFPGPLGVSLAGKALSSGLWGLEARTSGTRPLTDTASVDDNAGRRRPRHGAARRRAGGRESMPADAAPASPKDRPRLLMSPRGRPLTQSAVTELAAGPGPLIVCGRFEGVDQAGHRGPGLEEISIGDYVLFGRRARRDGADRRLRPPAAGGDGEPGIGCGRELFRRFARIPPIYRPQVFEGRLIPEILASGTMAKVRRPGAARRPRP